MNLTTEMPNAHSANLDLLPVSALLNLLNAEDHLPAIAVRRALPEIENVVRFLVAHFPQGGRILYLGAGTSGRLAFMDAAECPPTFGIDPERISVIMAGGREAVFRASEGREDDALAGERQVRDWNPGAHDCVIGLAASGRTPFVRAGLKAAHCAGAHTALICSNDVPGDEVDSMIYCETGPEALTGSTRLKAGTAAKMALNLISTAAMILLGRTYGNRMCHIRSANGKLSHRALETLTACCGIEETKAQNLLLEAQGDLACALTAGLSGAAIDEARAALAARNGCVREAVAELARREAARAKP